MGADLYIESIHEKLQREFQRKFRDACKRRDTLPKDSPEAKAAQEEVERLYDEMYSDGYFRDSYNSSSVLWRLGLSWWKDVGQLLDGDGNLGGDNLKKFRDMVAAARVKPITREEADADAARYNDEPISDTGLAEANAYYRDKHERLLAFIDQAIALKEPIHCSI